MGDKELIEILNRSVIYTNTTYSTVTIRLTPEDFIKFLEWQNNNLNNKQL